MVRTEPETAALHAPVVKLSDGDVGIFPDLTSGLKGLKRLEEKGAWNSNMP